VAGTEIPGEKSTFKSAAFKMSCRLPIKSENAICCHRLYKYAELREWAVRHALAKSQIWQSPAKEAPGQISHHSLGYRMSAMFKRERKTFVGDSSVRTSKKISEEIATTDMGKRLGQGRPESSRDGESQSGFRDPKS
jgi:hypothetical protein